MLELEGFLLNYGYAAILIGSMVEGETVLVLGTILALSGYLELPWVVGMACVGTFCGDQFFFLLGRLFGERMLARRPYWAAKAERTQEMLYRIHTPLIILFRFFYGLRSIIPFTFGMTRVGTVKFVLLDAVGTLLWASVVASAGYLFGNALQAVLGDIKRYEQYALLLVAGIGLLVWLGYFVRRSLLNRRLRSEVKTKSDAA